MTIKNSVRWIVDDVNKFLLGKRISIEMRTYDGIGLSGSADLGGRGPNGQLWKNNKC